MCLMSVIWTSWITNLTSCEFAVNSTVVFVLFLTSTNYRRKSCTRNIFKEIIFHYFPPLIKNSDIVLFIVKPTIFNEYLIMKLLLQQNIPTQYVNTVTEKVDFITY